MACRINKLSISQSVSQSVRMDLKVVDKVPLHHTGIIHWSVSLHHLAFSIDEKLGEIPLDTVSQEASPIGLLLQPLPQRVGIGPIHINLTEHRKVSIVALSKFLDLGFSARFLPPKLVRWEGQDA